MQARSDRILEFGAILAIAALVACSGESTGPGLESGPLTVADVEGAWTVDVPRTVACLPNREPFTIRFDLRHSSLAEFTGAVGEEYFSGTWQIGPDSEAFFVQGWVQLDAHTFRFLLWQGTHVKGSVLQDDSWPGDTSGRRSRSRFPPVAGGPPIRSSGTRAASPSGVVNGAWRAGARSPDESASDMLRAGA
jgi:hypothetical protein